MHKRPPFISFLILPDTLPFFKISYQAREKVYPELLFTANVIYLKKILLFKQNFLFSTSNSNFYTNFIKNS